MPRTDSKGLLRVWIVPLTLALVVAACGDGATDTNSDEVLDFSEIAAADPVVEPDSSGTSAVLRVTTTIDSICAVAFGETEELGMLATDDDMGGSAHADHQVTLGGLTPDTEYSYRLQGVGIDGRLYRSELFTFRTPPAEETGNNAALDAEVVEISSEFSDSFSASNAIDGNVATEWSSDGDGDEAYLVLDLGGEMYVESVGFQTRSMTDGSAITETFSVTVDDADIHGPFPAGRADVTFTGRVLRFDVETSTGGNTGATEIEVFTGPGG